MQDTDVVEALLGQSMAVNGIGAAGQYYFCSLFSGLALS
jgi:hypothetical protein